MSEQDAYDVMSTDEIKRLAKDRKVPGRSSMSRMELTDALREMDMLDAEREATEAAQDGEPYVPGEDAAVEPPMPTPAPEVPTAAEPPPPPPAGPQHYLVLEDFRFASSGVLHTLKAGSVVTRLTHNLAQLQQWGCKLEPCGKPGTAYDELGRPVTVHR